MSRTLLSFLVIAATSAPALSQAAYGPSDFASEESADASDDTPLLEAEPCEETEQEDGVIVVCRELPESERYLSPLPRPVQSDRRHVPGLTDPPCWVTNPGPGCIRFGYAPEPVLLIDLTQFPEPLSDEEAAAVTEIENPEAERGERLPQTVPPGSGRRVPIDISEDE